MTTSFPQSPGSLPPFGTPDLDGATSPDDLSRPLYGATPKQAITRFFKSYTRFTGRASLSEFWWSQLLLTVAMIPGFFLYTVGLVMVAGDSSASGAGVALLALGGILLLVIGAGVIVPSWALGWRRMHDAGFAGPMYLLNLVPSVGAIIVLVLAAMKSKPEGRQYDVAK